MHLRGTRISFARGRLLRGCATRARPGRARAARGPASSLSHQARLPSVQCIPRGCAASTPRETEACTRAGAVGGERHDNSAFETSLCAAHTAPLLTPARTHTSRDPGWKQGLLTALQRRIFGTDIEACVIDGVDGMMICVSLRALLLLSQLLSRTQAAERRALGESCSLRGGAEHRPCAERATLPLFRADGRHALPRLLAAAEPAGGCVGTVYDATQFSHVWDLTCGFIYDTAFYHSLVDCIIPSVTFWRHFARWARYAELAATALLVIPAEHEQWVQLLLSIGGKLPCRSYVVRQWHSHNGTCIRVADDAVVRFFGRTTRAWEQQLALMSPSQQEVHKRTMLTFSELLQNAQTLRSWALIAARVQPDAMHHFPTLLFIRRAKTRRLSSASQETIERELANRRPHLGRSVYYGNESLPDTIRLFASASVVLGVHGAAFANMLFCPPGAIVAELTWWNSVNVTDDCPAAVDWNCKQADHTAAVAEACMSSCRGVSQWRNDNNLIMENEYGGKQPALCAALVHVRAASGAGLSFRLDSTAG